ARLAEDQYLVRIAAEDADVVTHPLQRGHEVLLPSVGGVCEIRSTDFGQIKIAQRVQPVIDGHRDDVLTQRQSRAVIAGRAARALIKTAAVDPDHDGTLAPVIDSTSPDVEVETVFAGIASVGRPKDAEKLSLLLAARTVRLRRVMTEFKRVAHASPRFGRLWRHEAIRAASRRAIRY